MNAGEFLNGAAQELARGAMRRREAAIVSAIHDAVSEAWDELGAEASGNRTDGMAVNAITTAVALKLEAVSAAIAEADRTPPVVEVIEGEGPNVRIRTVVDPRTVPELLADYTSELEP